MAVPLLAELKRRRVFRALLGYAIVAFAVLQVIEPIINGLKLPDWTLSFVVVALCVAFPVVLVLAWVFDVSPSGVERTMPLGAEGTPRPSAALLAMLATGVALIGVAAVAWHFVSRAGARRAPISASLPAAPSVAVLPFVNMSREKDDEYFSDGIRAFTLLEQAYAEKDWLLREAKVSPMLDPLREDPRFPKLLRKLHLD